MQDGFEDWHYSSGWEGWPKDGPAHGGQWKNWSLSATITKAKGEDSFTLNLGDFNLTEHESLDAAKAAAVSARGKVAA